MDANPKALAKILLPRLPFILKTAALHSIGRTDTCHKWDLKTELTIKIIRSVITDTSDPKPISHSQKNSIRDPGIKGPMWINKTTLTPPPENDIRKILFKSIDEMKADDEAYTKPELLPVEAEWTGYRSGVPENAPELPISENEKYEHLMKEVTSDATILYFHGGAYYMLDPASHRGLTYKLAKMTGGRVLSVRYRLSPQTAFPGALLDGLHSYLSLLHPPPGSPHKAIPASHIVFAGDSAGANLASALMQLLLQIHRSSPSPSVQFHGQKVEIPLPAGMALNSPWLDITRCMPSLESNAKYDYLPTVDHSENHEPPPCDIWPTKPPRTDLFCEGNALCHPLVSTLAAMDWKNCPPVFITCGEEMLADENKVFVRRLSQQGVPVVWEQFEGMPHCFAMVLEPLGDHGAVMCLQSWAENIKQMVVSAAMIKAKGTWITAKKHKREDVNLGSLIKEMSDEDVLKRMRAAMERRVKGVDPEAKAVPRL
jgi:acetyl esterase/lipase